MDIDRRISVIINKMQYDVAQEVWNELNRNEIKYAIVKGCPLSLYKTGSPGDRMSSDIDLLILRKDINRIIEILEYNNFEPAYKPSRVDRMLMVASSHQVLPYKKIKGKFELELDINFDVFWGEYQGGRIDISEFLEDTVYVDIFEHKVKTIPPLKMLVLLILHHYKEMNSFFYLTWPGAIKKRFFEDIYMLCKRFPEDISVSSLYSISERYNIIPYVYYMLYYTRKVYDDIMLDDYLDVFYSEEGRILLNCYGLTEQERKVWHIDFGQRLDTDISKLVYDSMTKKDKEKLILSRKLFGYYE